MGHRINKIEKYKSYFNFQKIKSKQKNTSIAIDSLKMTTEKKAVDLGLLEEDDEFEEFPAEEWDSKQDQTDVNVWEDNWDDDAIEDDFSIQLRSELENQGMKMES